MLSQLVEINNLVFVSMKIPFQYPLLYCQCNTCGIEIAIFAQL